MGGDRGPSLEAGSRKAHAEHADRVPQRVEEVGADEGIPFSDHADYAELLVYIQLAKPARVYTVHGSGIFAKLLQQQGVAAQHARSELSLSILTLPSHRTGLRVIRTSSKLR
ncbi:MAG: hypothetical protein DRG69_09760 [Deltaproteobacteria bacterium]|nr:MAG: hypothetical protein DRG69_09760 [Deltaproteobacteria bacterium]